MIKILKKPRKKYVTRVLRVEFRCYEGVPMRVIKEALKTAVYTWAMMEGKGHSMKVLKVNHIEVKPYE